eukprot:g23153.t1
MTKVNIGPLDDEKVDLIMGNEEIAEVLNRYFMSVFTVEDMSNVPVINDKETKADIMSVVDSGDPVNVMYLDFQKAFDKVPHKRLLHKIK